MSASNAEFLMSYSLTSIGMSRLGIYLLLGWIVIPFTLSSPFQGEQNRVEEVFPTADTLPENLLRFYIYFTEPVQTEGVEDRISLLDQSGTQVTDVFLDHRYHLWSPDRTRLTVILHPGRVKTKLQAHDRLGRALEQGREYTLVIKPDTEGSLSETFRKTFRVGKALDTLPQSEDWFIDPPVAESSDALRIALDRSYDHHSLAYRIRVVDEEGNIVPGRIEVQGEEDYWSFQPRSPWLAQTYQIRVHHTLEDLAGNRLSSLFDRPIDQGRAQESENTTLLAFTPR